MHCVCLILLVAAPLSAAQPLAPEEAPSGEVPVAWYGWKVLVADATGLALVGWALSFNGKHDSAATVLATAGVGTYALAGPIIHGVHRGRGRVAGSLGFRLLTPIAASAVGLIVANATTKETSQRGLAVLGGAIAFGAVVGYPLATILDSTVAATEPPPGVPPRPSAQLLLRLERSGGRVALAYAF
jgi:hypothetical protein